MSYSKTFFLFALGFVVAQGYMSGLVSLPVSLLACGVAAWMIGGLVS